MGHLKAPMHWLLVTGAKQYTNDPSRQTNPLNGGPVHQRPVPGQGLAVTAELFPRFLSVKSMHALTSTHAMEQLSFACNAKAITMTNIVEPCFRHGGQVGDQANATSSPNMLCRTCPCSGGYRPRGFVCLSTSKALDQFNINQTTIRRGRWSPCPPHVAVCH